METYKKYNLVFYNEVVFGRVDKVVGGGSNLSFLFSPLSYYIYLVGHYEAISDVLIDVNKALNGESSYDGIEVGTERIILSKDLTTITSSNGKTQSIPTSDLKAILLEYEIFINTPPLNGAKA